MYCLDVTFSLVFGVDEDIIHIHNDEDIEFFRKDLIDIVLECCQSVGQSKKHYLILKVAVSGLESSLLLISFANSHPVVGTGELELGKLLCSPQSIQGLPNQRQWILVFDYEIVKFSIINTKLEATI